MFPETDKQLKDQSKVVEKLPIKEEAINSQETSMQSSKQPLRFSMDQAMPFKDSTETINAPESKLARSI